jgi:Arc-like DNA binding domain
MNVRAASREPTGRVAPVQIKFRVTHALRERLDEAAKARGHSTNAEIVRRLEQSFERREVVDGKRLWRELFLAGAVISGATARIYKAGGRGKDAMYDVADTLEQADARITQVLGETLPPELGETLPPDILDRLQDDDHEHRPHPPA